MLPGFHMTRVPRRTILRTIGAAGVTGFTGAAIVGADDEETTTGGGMATGTETGTPAAGGPAQVRVLHASPDAPAVDVYVAGDLAVEGLEFSTITAYLELAAGSYRVQVTPAGESPDAAVIDTNVTVEAGMAYTVAAAGLVENIQAVVYVDDNELLAGQARLRAVHLSPDAPAVDVAVADGPVLFQGLEFTFSSRYAAVDPGTYEIEIRPAGSEDVVASFPGVELQAETVYSAWALGLLEGEPAFGLKLTPDAGVGAEVETTTVPGTTTAGDH